MQFRFPPGFLWGAAISAYQCEGGNFNADWRVWEKEKNIQPCGQACGHYNLYKQDFELARALNHNALRFSLEWSRIYPTADNISYEAIKHYVSQAKVLRQLGIKPIVTLHHFTNPLWFVQEGGWEKSANIDFFLRYLRVAVEALKDEVDIWLIFNEPLVYVYNGYVDGIWPPGIKSLRAAKKVLDNITAAYIQGYKEIKSIYRADNSQVQVSFAKHMRVFAPCSKFSFGLNQITASVRHSRFNFPLLEKLRAKNCLDFIAAHYYAKEYSRFNGRSGAECGHDFHPGRRNALGWYVYPQGFYQLLKGLKRFGLPVYVTENGTAENEDKDCEGYLTAHLQSLAAAMRDGVDVRGYLWWSLLDNFEWAHGFKARFGLIEVDFNNMARKIKPFAQKYAKICKENAVEI